MVLLNKKINFHIHTKYSFDSFLEPKFIVDYLYQNGYEIAIITDHNTIKGAMEAKYYAEEKYKNKFTVIIGEEIKTDIGDVIGFPLIKEIEPGNYKQVIRQIKEQNALLCLPHPYKSHDLFLLHQDDFIEEFDIIEIFNSRLSDNLNEQAVRLAEKYNKIKIVGNDAHVKADLLNCMIFYNNSLERPEVKIKQTSIRSIRKSQIINFYKRKNLIQLLKYLIIFLFGK